MAAYNVMKRIIVYYLRNRTSTLCIAPWVVPNQVLHVVVYSSFSRLVAIRSACPMYLLVLSEFRGGASAYVGPS